MLTEAKIMTHFCREERDTVDPVVIQKKKKISMFLTVNLNVKMNTVWAID